jgi:hypothetical protein
VAENSPVAKHKENEELDGDDTKENKEGEDEDTFALSSWNKDTAGKPTNNSDETSVKELAIANMTTLEQASTQDQHVSNQVLENQATQLLSAWKEKQDNEMEHNHRELSNLQHSLELKQAHIEDLETCLQVKIEALTKVEERIQSNITQKVQQQSDKISKQLEDK